MKTYIFCIGGTGARVMKALAMLLTTGVEIETDEIVPIFIDPDAAAADLTRTISFLRDYQYINEQLHFTSDMKNSFFKTQISELIPGYRLILSNTQNNQFQQYMDFASLDIANQALAYMLFSEKNLGSNMAVGFKGNPNIGSVVLNQFAQSEAFYDFANSFRPNDRIFIVSSIFGGTGASGFPLLLKNLRGIDMNFPNAGNIKDAAIGAITVLPYFNLAQSTDGKNDIDSSTFISKAKAALEYYDKNISGNNSLNAFYYIADDIYDTYVYSVGGPTQANKAHVIELLSALAIVDFCKMDDKSLQSSEGKALNPIYKEFGAKSNDQEMIFPSFYDVTRKELQRPMTEFTLFCKFLNEHLSSSKSQKWTKGKHPFDDNFFNGIFFSSHLRAVKENYLQWLKEMASNRRGFSPFHLEEMKKDLFGFVKGIKPGKVINYRSNYDLFDYYLCDIEPRIPNNLSTEARFVELLYQTVNKLVEDKKLA